MKPHSHLRYGVCFYLFFCLHSPISAKTLKIISTPSGATVELDGKNAGTTPYEQDFPSSYFQRPLTTFQKRLEHPIHLRLTLSGYVTQEILLTIGPKDWLDLHRRSHGQYWLFKSDEFHLDLPPLPPSSKDASTVVTGEVFSSCPLPLPLSIRCASIPPLRRADQGFIRFSFAPLRRDPGRAALSFKTTNLIRRRPAPVAFFGGPSPGDLFWSHLRGGLS